jgi:hypothetical protein
MQMRIDLMLSVFILCYSSVYFSFSFTSLFLLSPSFSPLTPLTPSHLLSTCSQPALNLLSTCSQPALNLLSTSFPLISHISPLIFMNNLTSSNQTNLPTSFSLSLSSSHSHSLSSFSPNEQTSYYYHFSQDNFSFYPFILLPIPNLLIFSDLFTSLHISSHLATSRSISSSHIQHTQHTKRTNFEKDFLIRVDEDWPVHHTQNIK